MVDHGEVFTAEREVNAMLEMVKQETERIDERFGEAVHAKSARLRKTGQPINWLACEYLVEHRGIEPLTSGLQILHDTWFTWHFMMIILCNSIHLLHCFVL